MTRVALWMTHFLPGLFVVILGLSYLVQVYQILFRRLRALPFHRRGRLVKLGFRVSRASFAMKVRGRMVAVDGIGKVIMGLMLAAEAVSYNPPLSEYPLNAMALFHFALAILIVSFGLTDCLVVYKMAPKKLDFLWLAISQYLLAFILYNHYPIDAKPNPSAIGNHTHHHALNSTADHDDPDDEFGPTKHSLIEKEAHKYLALLLFIGGSLALSEIYYDLKSYVLSLSRCAQMLSAGFWLMALGTLGYPLYPEWKLIDTNSLEGLVSAVSFFMLSVMLSVWTVLGTGVIMWKHLAPDVPMMNVHDREKKLNSDEESCSSSDYIPILDDTHN